MGQAAEKYGAADIEVLEGLEPVRKRPGMFIAGTDTPAGLHQMVFEIVDNSVDEAMNGFADYIEVTLHKDGRSATVSDNGRGIPVERHPKFKIPTLELILTTLHAGGKFSGKNYRTSGGLHGVGSSVVNALSQELIATVRRGGKEYQQKFSQGLRKSALRTIRKSVRGTGTTIYFEPDVEIFKSVDFSFATIRENLRMRAYLNPGLKVIYIDETNETREEFHYTDGLRAYLIQLLEERKLKSIGNGPFLIDRDENVATTIALCWTENIKEDVLSYANGIHTTDGGSHEDGLKTGVVKAVRNYMNVHGLQPKGVKIGAEDIREGLVCLVSVKMPSIEHQAQFQGQTKSRLNNPEIAPMVEAAARSLEQMLNEQPNVAHAIVDRIVCSAKARAASRAAGQNVRRKIGVNRRLTLPGKLADCSSTNPNDCEIFIVEGDSAGGSAKQGRDRHTQAVLPLRGKVLNTISSPKKGIADNKELSNVISALGCGSGDSLRVDRLRYAKVIILTDADADGMHISTLLMAFFFTHMRKVIEQGCLYIGYPPLYGVFPVGGSQASSNGKAPVAKKGRAAGAKSRKRGNSKSVEWAYSDAELEKVLAKTSIRSPRITRYKGLGEMNPETLWDTTLDPKARTLLRITIDDEDLVRKELTALMGSDPAPRFKLIQESAHAVALDL